MWDTRWDCASIGGDDDDRGGDDDDEDDGDDNICGNGDSGRGGDSGVRI